MTRGRAVLGTVSFLVVAPGTVAGLAPWWITGWRAHPVPGWWWPVRVLGAALLLAGLLALLGEFARFAWRGLGTPAPIAPTRHLVVEGLYRYVRNPMYVAVITVLVGQCAMLASPALVGYTVCVAVAMVCFAHYYEERALLAQHGEVYRRYRDTVPGWLPTRGRPRS